MNELKVHVNHLFSKYKNHSDINELKEEILGNLEAKVSHLIAEGLNERIAIEEAKRSITSIDHLIDDNISVYIRKFQFKAFQIAFLYIIIAWIITIPFSLFRTGIEINFGLLFICFFLGIAYIIFARIGKGDEVGQINILSMMKTKKVLWMLWGLFIFISWIYLSAILFGSNIWFSRPIQINGPYQFGILVVRYALPLISIVIPLIYSAWMKLIPEFRVGEEDE